jgi:hypothetical protein
VGLVVIRVWVEPAWEGEADEALRARISTAKLADHTTEETFVSLGIEGVLRAVRGFLGELVGGAQPPAAP